jgi:ABC-2 type transport system permease protein
MRDGRIDAGQAGVILTGGTAFSPLPFMAVFMGIIGVFAFGHEYRHGTILATLTAVPRRSALVPAKCIVLAGWSLAAAAVSVVVNWAVARVIAGQSLTVTDDPAGPALLGYLGYVVLWALLGLGLGSLLRNLPAAIVILLVVPLVVEPLISALALLPALEPIRDYVYYLPFTAGNAMSQSVDPSAFGGGAETPFGDQPGRGASALTFTVWVALIVAPAVAMFHRRDA